MTNQVAHFSVQASNVERAVAFYEAVFGWTAKQVGPTDFYQIDPTESGIGGAIQKRRTFTGQPHVGGFECTVSVVDLDATMDRVLAAGGAIIMERTIIPGVGALMFFTDSEDNPVGAMQYDSTR